MVRAQPVYEDFHLQLHQEHSDQQGPRVQINVNIYFAKSYKKPKMYYSAGQKMLPLFCRSSKKCLLGLTNLTIWSAQHWPRTWVKLFQSNLVGALIHQLPICTLDKFKDSEILASFKSRCVFLLYTVAYIWLKIILIVFRVTSGSQMWMVFLSWWTIYFSAQKTLRKCALQFLIYRLRLTGFDRLWILPKEPCLTLRVTFHSNLEVCTNDSCLLMTNHSPTSSRVNWEI
jgi:hypothetical protein